MLEPKGDDFWQSIGDGKAGPSISKDEFIQAFKDFGDRAFNRPPPPNYIYVHPNSEYSKRLLLALGVPRWEVLNMLDFELTHEERQELSRLIDAAIGTTMRGKMNYINPGDAITLQLVGGYGLVEIPLSDDMAIRILRQMREYNSERVASIAEFFGEIEG